MLQKLHESHLGVVKSKSLARSYVWWPNLGNDIKNTCKTCENCSPHKKSQNKAILNPWPCPNAVWERIHLNFLGPMFNKHFLVIVDAFSKWLEVFPMNSITTTHTLDILKMLWFAQNHCYR